MQRLSSMEPSASGEIFQSRRITEYPRILRHSSRVRKYPTEGVHAHARERVYVSTLREASTKKSLQFRGRFFSSAVLPGDVTAIRLPRLDRESDLAFSGIRDM